jgi:hypothetical protein
MITDQINTNQINQNHINTNQINQNHINTNQINQNHINQNHINQNHINQNHINTDQYKYNIDLFNIFTNLLTFGKSKQIIPTNETDFLNCLFSSDNKNIHNTTNTTATLFFDAINKSNSVFLTGIVQIYIDDNIVYSNEIHIGKYVSKTYGIYMALFNGLQKISLMNIYNVILKTSHYKIINQIQNNSANYLNPQIKEYYIGVKRMLRNMDNIKYDHI